MRKFQAGTTLYSGQFSGSSSGARFLWVVLRRASAEAHVARFLWVAFRARRRRRQDEKGKEEEEEEAEGEKDEEEEGEEECPRRPQAAPGGPEGSRRPQEVPGCQKRRKTARNLNPRTSSFPSHFPLLLQRSRGIPRRPPEAQRRDPRRPGTPEITQTC